MIQGRVDEPERARDRPGRRREDLRPTSELLRELRERGGGDRVLLEEVTAVVGGRAHGLAMVLLGLPELVPMVGLSAVLALPILLVGASMIWHGADPPLPRWVRNRSVGRARLQRALDRTAGLVRRLDRIARPRWPALAMAGRLQGTVLVAMAVVLAVPVPGVNIVAALAVVGTGLGILQRDGVVFFGAAVAAVLAAVGMAAVAVGAVEVVQHFGGG